MRLRNLVLLVFTLFPAASFGGKEEVAGEIYRSRYPLSTAAQKLVDNKGRGPAHLYGTRNFRAVLNGVYYRGGGNNKYHNPPRANSNPLPTAGLRNLCEEGFSRAVYLYAENYETAPHSLRCRTQNGNESTLEYKQISPLAHQESDLKALLVMIHRHAQDSRLGPIYDHCWNGWHASGYVAASALRQFCGFSAEQAVAYWNLNTDGNNEGAGYDRIRARIRAFRPFPGLALSARERAVLCPAPGTLRFATSRMP